MGSFSSPSSHYSEWWMYNWISIWSHYLLRKTFFSNRKYFPQVLLCKIVKTLIKTQSSLLISGQLSIQIVVWSKEDIFVLETWVQKMKFYKEHSQSEIRGITFSSVQTIPTQYLDAAFCPNKKCQYQNTSWQYQTVTNNVPLKSR